KTRSFICFEINRVQLIHRAMTRFGAALYLTCLGIPRLSSAFRDKKLTRVRRAPLNLARNDVENSIELSAVAAFDARGKRRYLANSAHGDRRPRRSGGAKLRKFRQPLLRNHAQDPRSSLRIHTSLRGGTMPLLAGRKSRECLR